MNKDHETPFPIHAREQIQERYGVELTKKQWFYFGRTLCNPNLTIQLSDAGQGCHFCACYFMEHWYLLICTRDGTVKTAYPRRDIADADKQILQRDERYRRINRDEFHVWRTPHAEMAVPSKGKPVKLPNEAELPTNVVQSAESFLNQFCE